MKRPRAALFGFLVAMAIVHAVVGSWTPLQGEDWTQRVWTAQHAGSGVAAWLRAHVTFSDAVSDLLARCRAFHVIVSPAVGVALVLGAFVIAMRRLPRATWPDVLGIALVSASIWIAQPHAGVTWFHTPSVAMHVYGVAVALWFVAPWRCGWQVPRALWPVLAVAGYCVGTSTRAIATATVVALVVAIRAMPRERRARWMWVALGGLVVGVAVGYARPPWVEFGRVFRRGLDPNLVLLNLPIQEAGRLVSLVAALVVADLVLGALDKSRAPADARPDPSDALRWIIAWFATAVWCLFGPRYYEATFLPATVLLVIAALPYLLWLARSRVLGAVIVTIVVAVHLVVWPIAVVQYHRFGVEGEARVAILERTPPGGLAVIRPYSQILPTFWFFGEDLSTARLRQLVGLEVFGLRDIAIDPAFRRLEANPALALALDIDGASDAELRAARVPGMWSTVPSVAREQFEQFVRRFQATTGRPISARLVVTNVRLVERGARPLLAAWADRTGTVIPRTAISPIDENNEFTVRTYGDEVKRFNEAWIVDDGVARSTPYRNGSPRLRPLTSRLNVIVLCNKDRCVVADAFVPRF